MSFQKQKEFNIDDNKKCFFSTKSTYQNDFWTEVIATENPTLKS